MPFPSSTHHHMLSSTLFPVSFSTVPIESNCRSIRHACSRQPNHRRTRQVSVIICVIARKSLTLVPSSTAPYPILTHNPRFVLPIRGFYTLACLLHCMLPSLASLNVTCGSD